MWIRDGWKDKESSIESTAKQAGQESSRVYVFIPRHESDQLKKMIARFEAARKTIDTREVPNSKEGQQAYQAMETRKNQALQELNEIISEALDRARVYLSGGQLIDGRSLSDMVTEAARKAVSRKYHNFDRADNDDWHKVWREVKKGNNDALSKLGYDGNASEHDVCRKVLEEAGTGTEGKEIRDHFEDPPYGWPREAISSSLVLLSLTGHLRPVKRGEQVEDITDLSQSDITSVNFRQETTTLTTKEKINIRKIYQQLNIKCDQGEVLSRCKDFLRHLKELNEEVSGSPPLPKPRSMEFLTEIEDNTGNERLAQILEHEEELENVITKLKQWKDRKESRWNQWEKIKKFLNHAENISGVDSIQNEIEAIKDQRSLLTDSNPLNDLEQQLADLLRNNLNEKSNAYEEKFEKLKSQLQDTDAWNELSENKKEEILKETGLETNFSLKTGTKEELLESLDACPLREWESRIDALDARFSEAREQAANELTPDAQKVDLPSRTLESKEDVEEWIEEVKTLLEEKIDDHPLIT